MENSAWIGTNRTVYKHWYLQFPLESSKEKEKIWQGIKAKINTKYQVGKLLTVQVN